MSRKEALNLPRRLEPLHDPLSSSGRLMGVFAAAAYAMHTMPIGTTFDAPVLSDEDAYDVAAYIISQKRPQKANLDRDFPIRLQKPIDTPYGPYADGFSVEQHRFGPFGPIRAKVRELAAESGTASAGGPDNGSDEFRRAR
jgi:thiosulfate dehydrogenase